MTECPSVLPFGNLATEFHPQVGGKCASLGVMIQAGLPVPPGFAITTHAFAEAGEASGLMPRISELLAQTDITDSAALKAAAAQAPWLAAPDDAELQAVVAELLQRVDRARGPQLLREAEPRAGGREVLAVGDLVLALVHHHHGVEVGLELLGGAELAEQLGAHVGEHRGDADVDGAVLGTVAFVDADRLIVAPPARGWSDGDSPAKDDGFPRYAVKGGLNALAAVMRRV